MRSADRAHRRRSSAGDLDDSSHARGYLWRGPGNRPARKDLPPVAGERTSGSWPGSLSRGMAAPALCVLGPGRAGRSHSLRDFEVARGCALVAPIRSYRAITDRCPRAGHRAGRRSVGRRTGGSAGPPQPERVLGENPERENQERSMPPPVAVPRDAPAHDLPASAHPATAPDARGRSTSLGHVASLVRAAMPPMHPGGRPIVGGVAVAAVLTRLLTGRGALAGALATAATAAFFRNPHRVPPSRTGVVLSAADGTVALVSDVVPPPELDLPAGAGAARQRLPLGARRARPAHPGRRARRRRAVPPRPVPVRGPGQGQRRQRAQRPAAARPSTGPGSGSSRSPVCWPAGSAATSRRATRWRRARPTG